MSLLSLFIYLYSGSVGASLGGMLVSSIFSVSFVKEEGYALQFSAKKIIKDIIISSVKVLLPILNIFLVVKTISNDEIYKNIKKKYTKSEELDELNRIEFTKETIEKLEKLKQTREALIRLLFTEKTTEEKLGVTKEQENETKDFQDENILKLRK